MNCHYCGGEIDTGDLLDGNVVNPKCPHCGAGGFSS